MYVHVVPEKAFKNVTLCSTIHLSYLWPTETGFGSPDLALVFLFLEPKNCHKYLFMKSISHGSWSNSQCCDLKIDIFLCIAQAYLFQICHYLLQNVMENQFWFIMILVMHLCNQ